MEAIFEKESITYPMSLDYVKNWSWWEALRELISNAIDTQSEYAIVKDNNNLIIADNGKGLQIKQLLFGVSEKDSPEAIGQFGEGLKLALLVLTRMGKRVLIQSGDLRIENDKNIIDGITVLKLNYWKDINVPGTEIIIYDWDGETFDDRFLSKNDDRIIDSNKYGKILTENKLFVKGIYVMDLPDFSFGYECNEIKMNRDRSAVDNWTIEYSVGQIWSSIENKEAWKYFFEVVKNGCKEKSVHINNYRLTPEAKIALTEGFALSFGKDSVLRTNTISEREAEHRGAKLVDPLMFGSSLFEVLREVVKTDEKFVYEKRGAKAFSVNLNTLTTEQKTNLRLTKRIMKKLGHDIKIEICDIPDGNLGRYNTETKTIELMPVVLLDIESSLDVLIHEMAHAVYGTTDLTDSHVNACTKLAAKLGKIILNLA